MWSPVRSTFSDGQMGHEVIGGCAVPVLLAIRSEDDIADTEFNDVFATGLYTAATFGHVESLAAIVRVPGATSARGEVHSGHVEMRRRQSSGNRINPNVSRERP